MKLKFTGKNQCGPKSLVSSVCTYINKSTAFILKHLIQWTQKYLDFNLKSFLIVVDQ